MNKQAGTSKPADAERMMTAADVAHHLSGGVSDEYWDQLMDGDVQGVGIDVRATETATVGGAIVLDAYRGLVFHDGSQWIPVTYPDNLCDPSKWKQVADRHRKQIRSKRRWESLRQALFIRHTDMAEILGWATNEAYDACESGRYLVGVTFDDDPTAYYVPRAWFDYTGVIPRRIDPLRFTGFILKSDAEVVR